MRFKYFHILLVLMLTESCFEAENHKYMEASDESLQLINGVLYCDNERFNGFVVTYFEDAKLKSEAQYQNGRKHGYERQWFSTGALVYDRYYLNGRKTGVHKGWWENGNLKFELHFNHDGAYNGAVKEWYESGQLFRSFNYKNGQEIGIQQLWKPDGSIKANYQVLNGERFGLIGLKKCFTVTSGKNEI